MPRASIVAFASLLMVASIQSSAHAALLLNEVMPVDRSWAPDEDGDYPGWVELFNSGTESIDLAGFGLSENPGYRFQWTFPEVILNGGEHLLVFTSGKNRRAPSDSGAKIAAGDPSFRPQQLPGLLWWLDASDSQSVEAEDGWVGRWLDKTGRTQETTNGVVHFDAVALQKSQRPLLASDPATGLPAVRFDGEQQVLNFPEIQGIQTIFWVLQEPKTASDSFRPFLGHDTDDMLVRNFDRLLWVHSYATRVNGIPVDPRYTRLPRGRVAVSVMLEFPTRANSLAQSLKYPDLRWAGDMMEVLVFDRVLSEEERVQVQGYLDRKWLLPSQSLHTGFRMSPTKALYLTAPDGAPIDTAPPVVAEGEISRGRVDQSNQWQWFAEPTPGRANRSTAALLGRAAPPVFETRPGRFTNPFQLVLSTAGIPEAVIYYSTDGSEPTAQKYTGPISIETNVTVRARVEAPGYIPSPILTGSYYLPLPGNLAVVSVTTPPKNLWDDRTGIYVAGPTNSEFYPNFEREWERPIRIEWFEPDGTLGFATDAGVKIHGLFSRSFPQRSLRVHFRERYGLNELNYPVFPDSAVSRFDSIILRNFGNDWNIACMRDAVGHALGAQMNLDHQAWRPVHVFLNGEYNGVYEVRERLDADQLASHHHHNASELDVIRNASEIVAGDSEAYQALNLKVRTMNPESESEFTEATRDMDLDNFSDWLALELYADNSDWPLNNVTIWRERKPEAQWKWALNDLDSTFNGWGFGADSNTVHRVFTETPLGEGRLSPIDFIRQIPLNPAFRNQFANRFADLLNTTLSASNVLDQIERIHGILAPAMPAQIARWGSESNGLVPLSSMGIWETNVDVLREFATHRTDLLWRHLINEFGLEGTVPLNLAAPNPEAIRQLQVNSIVLTEPFTQWSGLYFQRIPVTLSVTPKPGWRLAGWEGRAETNSTLTLVISGGERLAPILVPDDTSRIHALAAGDFQFTQWDASNAAGTYPHALFFQETATKDPGLETLLEGTWTNRYDLDSKSRIIGRGTNGISFLNTSDTVSGGGYLGAAVVRLNTRGRHSIRVSWTASTIEPNARPYSWRLQWRPGNTGPFLDVLDAIDQQPIQYDRSLLAGHSARFDSVPLPRESADRDEIQVRWKYFAQPASATGSRAELGLDDIEIRSQPRLEALPVLSMDFTEPQLRITTTLSGSGKVSLYTSTDLKTWTLLETRQLNEPGRVEFIPLYGDALSRFFQMKIE